MKILPLLCALLIGAPAIADAAVSRQKIIENIRKQFSTPKNLTMKIGELSPSSLKGYLKGTIHFDGAGQKSSRDIHVSKDGTYYFLAPVYGFKPSNFPGLLEAAGDKNLGPAPPIFLSADGKYFFVGNGIGAPQNASVDPDEENLKKIILKDVFDRGAADAPIVLVEFSDLQCPYCKMAHEMLSANLEKKYGKKVRWVSKQYPLRNNHPWAFDAAVAALCAGKEGKKAYNAMQDAIFHAQREITPENLRSQVLGFADKAGLKKAAFTQCVDKKQTAALVEADIREGDALGVASTPTIFVNGRKIGHIEFSNISEAIDEKLAEVK